MIQVSREYRKIVLGDQRDFGDNWDRWDKWDTFVIA